jgi:hypothetical protein
MLELIYKLDNDYFYKKKNKKTMNKKMVRERDLHTKKLPHNKQRLEQLSLLEKNFTTNTMI